MFNNTTTATAKTRRPGKTSPRMRTRMTEAARALKAIHQPITSANVAAKIGRKSLAGYEVKTLAEIKASLTSN